MATNATTAKPLAVQPTKNTTGTLVAGPTVTDHQAGTATTENVHAKGNTATTNLSTAQKDAFAQVQAQLDAYGLGSLSTFVYNEIVTGKSPDEITRDLRQTPEFKQRFPAIAAREAAGLPALSPGEYVAYEQSATQLMRAAGLPQGMYDSPSDFTALLTGDVSVSELNDRIDAAKAATFNIPAEAQNRLWSEFGMAPGSGSLTAFFLDPDKALPLLQRDLMAAQIGGRADQSGYSGVTNAEALNLAQNGITDAQAQAGFGQLQHNRQLFQQLPGEAGDVVTHTEQIGATFLGDSAAQDKIEAERRKRQAEFQDGSAFGATQKGVTGLAAADAT